MPPGPLRAYQRIYRAACVLGLQTCDCVPFGQEAWKLQYTAHQRTETSYNGAEVGIGVPAAAHALGPGEEHGEVYGGTTAKTPEDPSGAVLAA